MVKQNDILFINDSLFSSSPQCLQLAARSTEIALGLGNYDAHDVVGPPPLRYFVRSVGRLSN